MTRIAINGFGRMGRLALRAAWDRDDLTIVHVNELHGDAATGAHLLTFDSVHGRWDRDVRGDGKRLMIQGAKRGDVVVTSGGLIGKITKAIDDGEVEVEIAPNVRVRVARSGIADVRSKGEPVKDTPAIPPAKATK